MRHHGRSKDGKDPVPPRAGHDGSTGYGRQEQTAHQRKQLQAGDGRARPFDDLEVQRQESDGAKHCEADQQGDDAGGDEDPVAEQPHRDDRLGSLAFSEDEGDDCGQAEGCQPEDLPGCPGIRGAAQRHHQYQRGQCRREQTGAEVVDAVLRTRGDLGEGQREDDGRRRTDGEVDVEDPAPRQAAGEPAAQQRPDHRRDAENGAEHPLVTAPGSRRHDVPDRCLRR